jgi:hypothetical protein
VTHKLYIFFHFQVFFVDFGKSEEYPIEALRQMPTEVLNMDHFQAMEFRLAGVRPNIKKFSKGQVDPMIRQTLNG